MTHCCELDYINEQRMYLSKPAAVFHLIAAFPAAARRIVAEVEAVTLSKKRQICRTNDARRARVN